MARPTLFKVSLEEFRNICLEYLVNEKGEKVVWRKVIKMKSFQDRTGYYREVDGVRKPVSIGSASYWLNQLSLYEEEIFHYHQQVTKRIKEGMTYKEWVKKSKSAGLKGCVQFQLMDDDLVRKTLTIIAQKVEYFKSECNKYDIIEVFYEGLKMERTFKNKPLTLNKLIIKIYKKLQNNEEITDKVYKESGVDLIG